MNLKTTRDKPSRPRLLEYDPSETLRDPEGIFSTFMECLQEGDHVAAREVLAGGLRHMNKSKLARSHGIPRRTLYNFFDKKSAPGLDLVAKVCRAIRRQSADK